ncbi:alpha/beta-hydrolase [Laetiporus sulphureus 93-53]|uniref:Alpha/beta-hydrolase n=1 Tax=Laetiporus sulphureus 93-53 TaxID=1314785 RepID=A0A165B2U6_9APHY|nr:alpha/beta-hydrolase [Laetiporus sulphureus 93-53]KZT00116.1 alpha/beta-hydrolase [Laetiporus sulphureus 93-53]
MSKKTAPYGTWKSPISADAILQSGSKVAEVFVDPITSAIYHVEKRPSEGGRDVVVRTEEGRDVVGKGWNTRTGVQEYGGAPAIAYNGVIYFSNYVDNKVYEVREGKEPTPITLDNKNHRFAKLDVHPKYPHFLVAIMEDHTKPAPPDVATTLCIINSETSKVSTIVVGADFYAYPYFSPDGLHLAWQQWSHPDMPWEGAEIFVAEVIADEHTLTVGKPVYVAGKKNDISASSPGWASSDVLLFTTDESGYQNPWKYSVSSGKASAILPSPVKQDFSQPMKNLGWEYGAPLDDTATRALFAAMKDDRSVLYVVTLQSGALEEIKCPYIEITGVKRVARDSVVFLAQKDDEPTSVVICSLKDYSMPQFSTVKASSAGLQFPRSLISIPQPVTLSVPQTNEPLHVLYLPPTNPDYEAPEGEKPPCIVNAHGGPTGRDSPVLDLSKQFFTSRGWAWLDVNYGGSSGYGRKYMERLAGKWGIVDVEDCINATQQLAAPPYSLIDPKRSIIRGGSAGGYTTLATLCSHPDIFAAATSLYGIADLRVLCNDTHKFESHYMEKLMGGTLDEIPEVYKDRSPIFHADQIKTPLLVLQGSDDAVVPPAQAKIIVDAITKRGGRVELHMFDGEGHGWRKAETIKEALERELYFYEDVFGIAGGQRA